MLGAFVLFCTFNLLKECKDFHQAKDGDGWVEQSSQPFLFGLLQKVCFTHMWIDLLQDLTLFDMWIPVSFSLQ